LIGTLLPIATVADQTGHPIQRLRYWIMKGIKVPPDGGRVWLYAQRVGGRWYTSKESVDVFRQEIKDALDAARQ
jgi:hypothetical protein